MDKDRESVHPIVGTDDVQIVYRRSSARPVEYAILLQVRGPRAGKPASWPTTPTLIATLEHHCHRYLEREKQPAEPLPFEVADTNDAMAKVIDWFADNWTELIS